MRGIERKREKRRGKKGNRVKGVEKRGMRLE